MSVSLKKARELCSEPEYEIVSLSYPGPIGGLMLEEVRSCLAATREFLLSGPGKSKARLFKEAMGRFSERLEQLSFDPAEALPQAQFAPLRPRSSDPKRCGGRRVNPAPPKNLEARSKAMSAHQRAATKRAQFRRDVKNAHGS